MIICKADIKHIDIIEKITIKTIKQIYPKYYPAGAVDFFINHHKTENIKKDILSDCVYILINDDSDTVGTVTINKNEINRLFVLPEFQGMGFGTALLNFAENLIFESYQKIIISASLPAKQIYLKRGYTEISYNTIKTENGDYLCYDEMKKINNKDR